MAYDEELAQRVREALRRKPNVTEVRVCRAGGLPDVGGTARVGGSRRTLRAKAFPDPAALAVGRISRSARVD